jgi:hypothetical protein
MGGQEMNVFKKWYLCINKFLFPEIEDIISHFNSNQMILKDLSNILYKEIGIIERELNFQKAVNNFFFNKSPDMAWIKDLDGVYIKTNEAINNGLLMCENPIGKTDIELAKNAKLIYGDTNHTFGEKCFNSDLIVMEKVLNGTFKMLDGRFLESGKVKGKTLYLEVLKYPFYVNNEFCGIAGIGRDITEYVEAYRENDCGRCPSMKDIFKKYEFGEDM